MRAFLVATGAVLAVYPFAPLLAQSTGTARMVVPDLTETDGIANASSGQPWAATTTSVRIQQLYGAGDFPYGTPVTITRIRFRPRDYTPSTVNWTGGTYRMEIRMSTTARTPATLSTIYATNPGPDQTVVHNGPVVLQPGNGNAPGPSQPFVDLTLTTPFRYDPSGGCLLVDFISDGAQYTGGTAYFPAVDRFGQADAARVWHVGDTTSASGIYENYSGLVMDFDFTFTGTHADFFADELGARLGTPLQFFDRSIAAAAGGIQSWRWDFDNDGTIDSTQQNPSHVYAAPGRYDVKLTVTSNGGSDAKTKIGYVVIGDPRPSVPDVLQYQFNEVRGTTVANTASGSALAVAGTVSNSGWQGDPGVGREGFRGNEAGFGIIDSSGLSDDNWVDTGGGLTRNGSISLSWWQRMQPGAPSNAWAYVFGGPGATFTAYNRGGAYSAIMFVGTPSTGDLLCLKDLHHPNWVHLCLVVDDAAGTVTWYVDGLPAGTKSYTAGTHSITNTQFFVGKNDSSVPTHAMYYATDDFRVYGRALSYDEVLGTMLGENASAGRFGTACSLTGSTPEIFANGRPTLGNQSFSIGFRDPTYTSQPIAVIAGFTASANLPRPLTPIVGCGFLEVSLDVAIQVATDGSGAATFAAAIPNDLALRGAHVYFQCLTFIGATQGLDLNLQER